VPAAGSSKLLIVQFGLGGGRTPSATQNGVPLTIVEISGPNDRAHHWYGYLANPSSGTFSITWTGDPGNIQLSLMTLKDAAQINPTDVSNLTDITASASSISTSVTTTVRNDLLLDEVTAGGA